MEINSSTEEHSKKQSLEEMSKEELIKKCKNLLTIAQKAKQAKDQAAQEVATLKEKLTEKESASQELIANITQQKLNLVTKLEDFKQQNSVLSDKFAKADGKLSEVLRINSELDTENQGYKRQIARLSDENDSLLNQLDGLEKESGELKSRLSDLEEHNRCLSTANEVLKSERNGSEVQELQKMLSVSLQEVKKLQSDNAGLISENETLLKRNEEVKAVLEQLEVENAVLKGDLKTKQEEIEKCINSTDDLNVELHKNRAVIENLRQDLANTNARFSESQIMSSGVASDLQNANEKLKEKLRLYHSKLVKFAGDVKSLKQDKIALMNEFKDYTNHVVEWKGQLKVFSELFVKEFNKSKKQQDVLSEENRLLKEKLEELEANLKSNVSADDLENNKAEIENLMKQLEDLKQNSAEEIKLINQKFAKISKLVTENADSEENDVINSIEKLLEAKSRREQLESEVENLRQQVLVEQNTTRDLENQNKVLMDENENLIKRVEDLKENSAEEVKLIHQSFAKISKLVTENPNSEENVVINSIEKLLASKSRREELESEVETLKQQVLEKEYTTRDLENQKNVLRDENEDLIKQLEDLKENSTEKINIINQRFAKISKLVTESPDSDENDVLNGIEALLAAKARTEQLESEINDLKLQILEKDSTPSDLENQNKLLKNEIENFVKQLEDLKQNSAEEIKLINQRFAKISKLVTENPSSDENDVLRGIETLLAAKSRREELENEVENLKLQISENENVTKKLETQNSDYQTKIFELEKSVQEFQASKAEKIDVLTKSLKEKESESEQHKTLLQSITTFINKPDCDINHIDQELKQVITSLNNTINDLQNQIQHANETEAQLAEKSSQEIISLADKNKELEQQIAELQKKNSLNESGVQTDETSDSQDQLSILKRENAELLAEMNEMNQVLKERGEIISKQQAYCDEIVKKFETQAKQNTNSLSLQEETIKNLQAQLEKSGSEIVKQKNEEIAQLQSEIEGLKEKLKNSGDQDTGYAESENLSTSTYSRSEEINRLKDLEGSWEERYGKLRNLAVRLKGKVKELTVELSKEQSEKTEFQQKLANSVKTVQTLQTKCDKLEDNLEIIKTENKNLLKKLDVAAMDISKDKRLLAENEDTITKLKSDIEEFKKEKENIEKWKKQVSSKVQTLKKEIEANSVLKKEFEAQTAKLHADLETKEQELKNEIEMHKQTKALLQESNNECKKQSVLTLEMHDYERSVKELSQKLEIKEEAITTLKNQLESQKSTINALREQTNILEERQQTEDIELNNAKADIATQKRKISDLEDVIAQKDEKIHSLMSNFEECRRENEELSTELSKVIAEHQKASSGLKTEKEFLRSQNLGMEQKLRELQETLKLKEQELANVQSEYQSYKIRAQSVLRQNQTRDIGLEEKLSQEAENLKVQNARLNEDLDATK